jgi:hypothetical protein
MALSASDLRFRHLAQSLGAVGFYEHLALNIRKGPLDLSF